MGAWFQFVSFSTLAAIPLAVVMYMTLYDQSPGPWTTYFIDAEYDYIVVGAGSAGSTVASRLSEKECVSVLLLEAGGSPLHLDNVPLIGRFRWFTEIDWAYLTVPQNHTGSAAVNRQIIWPSGLGLGGSTLINAMLYVRGSKDNYNSWGVPGWSYDDVFPYFLKMEDYRDEQFANTKYHSTGGPMTIEKPSYHANTREYVFQAANDFGYNETDSNGERMTGFYNLSATMRDSERCMTSKAYLIPASGRPNFDILKNARVTKILMDGTKAIGVQYEWMWFTWTVKARKEVIISAGTTNTAQLLMLSGIGPKDQLDELKIPVVKDLPVGKFMMDHCSVIQFYELTKDKEPTSLFSIIWDYTFHRSGFLASAESVDVLGFINTKTNSTEVDLPNVELYFINFPIFLAGFQFGLKDEVYKKAYKPYEEKSIYACFASVVQPLSVGSVKLQSADPHDSPAIDPNYFADPEDLKAVLEGMKLCTKIVTSQPMQVVGAQPIDIPFPGCEDKFGDEDAYYTCLAQAYVVTMSHQVGTAKMGKTGDKSAVVDPDLKVLGITGLRVVDASVMPNVPSGNTNIPTIMIAEKASDIIKKDIAC